MKKIIIFVEHGGINKEFTLKKAFDFGFRIILATTKVNHLVYKYVKESDIIVTDTFNPEDLVADVTDFLQTNKITPDAVISFKESSVIPTAHLAESLGLKGVGVRASKQSSQNKLDMRESLSNLSTCNQPKYINININDDDYLINLKGFPKPCVIKPLFGSSSHGVKKIINNDNLERDIRDVKQSMRPDDREVFKNFDGTMLVEEYIEGTTVSIDGLVIDGEVKIIGSTQFIMGEEPYFQQIASFIPPNIEKSVISECKNLTEDVISTLGFNTCGFHCEWRIKADTPYFLEIAARTVGGGILLGYEKVTGIDMIECLFKTLLGEKVDISPESRMCVLHKSVLPSIKKESKLISFEGFEKLDGNKNIWHKLKFASKGDKLLASPETPTQLYYYALKGPSIDFLFEESRIVEDQIFYKTEDSL